MASRKSLFGENKLPETPPASFFALLVRLLRFTRATPPLPGLLMPFMLSMMQYGNLKDPIILLLIAAALVSERMQCKFPPATMCRMHFHDLNEIEHTNLHSDLISLIRFWFKI